MEIDTKFIPRAEIESIAAELLKKHGLFGLPVNPLRVALAERIGVYSIDFKDDSVSGILRKEDGEFGIYVNSAHHSNRMRYTIAHELAHHVLHRHLVDAFVDPDINMFRSHGEGMTGGADMEVQANMFAAALLMPEELVRNEYAKVQDISTLAEQFGVSSAAMGYRVANLDL